MNSLNHGVYFPNNDLFKCDWFDNTPNIWTKVYNKYEIIEVRESRRYNKAYDSFIFVQQTKTLSRIIDSILSETEQEAPYQDNDFVEL
ncbi:hypothetical protein CR513_45027, partial [Mucuna pruriens]